VKPLSLAVAMALLITAVVFLAVSATAWDPAAGATEDLHASRDSEHRPWKDANSIMRQH
jgi:hypothetical protein